MKRRKKVLLGICIFLLSLVAGIASKFLLQPTWTKQYSINWSGQLGELKKDLSYGEGDQQKYDLYLPKGRKGKMNKLVVYLHAGGFTQGDKSDDEKMLSWLTSKGYVAAGINYTLATETNKASVFSQSQEIKEAIPKVIETAKKEGYRIDEMAIAGGSAGGALAMIYAYRDATEAPVPVKMLFEAVGPASFHVEDWGIYGLDKDTQAAATFFSTMAGQEITKEMISDGSYLERVKPISADQWITPQSVPSVLAYGKFDKVQPFKAAKRLEEQLKQNQVDHHFFELSHSGHGLQNDSKVYKAWMETVEKYLDKYLPIEN